MSSEPPRNLVDSLGREIPSTPRRKWTITKERFAGIAAATAVLALFATNADVLLSKVYSVVTNAASDKTPDPILLNLGISDSNGYLLNRLRDDTSCLLDITVLCGGSRKLLITEFELRHYKGVANSMSTGQLKSAAKYQFTYTPNQHLVARFAPEPLVIVPSDEQLLHFQIEVAPKGPFSTSAGSVYAQLNYVFDDGTKGCLPLIVVPPGDRRSVSFPDLSKDTSEPKFEWFRLTKNGNVIGMMK